MPIIILATTGEIAQTLLIVLAIFIAVASLFHPKVQSALKNTFFIALPISIIIGCVYCISKFGAWGWFSLVGLIIAWEFLKKR